MKAQQSDATLIQIGKNGITDGLIIEIKRHLNARKTVKIKILRSQTEEKGRGSVKDTLLARIGMSIEAKAIGNTILLKKKR